MAKSRNPAKVTSPLSRFEKTFEIFANQQAAELEAVRAILQLCLVSILSNHPQGRGLFDALRTEALKRLANEITLAGGDQDATRKAEFVSLYATRIFDEMAPAFGLGQ